ncbi:TOMM precursor leader peptide-binding protein [Cryobacterium sp. TMT1-19]|uniref:TOMM precursor leader peptide-binding protein n=1 Tax=unclassified Cryobacterium TaxID=2649013 RepID=UPI000CE3762A|nr:MULTISPECIES: TOMM precursor leader peptide-binding protein [unclassified Cryobacterium]TFD34818.1 TOMM precursor leader peptide-binding protein [Cryobacterium sp. TMT1-19]
MTLRLDPRYPVVWRSPDIIQVGVDRPLVVITALSPGLERVLAALFVGVPRSGALMIGREGGASDEAILALLRALRPALLVTAENVPGPARMPEPVAVAPPPRICVDGCGLTADLIRTLIGTLGLTLAKTDDPGTGLAVVLGHYALEPERHGRWLRRDIPHLPVVFSDSEVRIGPLVEPGVGPCLYCLELAHMDSDPSWAALACQLLSRRAPTETPRAGIDVAALVAGIGHDRLVLGRSTLTETALVFDVASGTLKRRGYRPHESCGCRTVPGNVTALPGAGRPARD